MYKRQHLAGVNECTLFRKFKNKKDIVLNGVAQEKWRANIPPELFQNVVWELGPDLEMFMTAYMDRITPDFVNLSIGLRAPPVSYTHLDVYKRQCLSSGCNLPNF